MLQIRRVKITGKTAYGICKEGKDCAIKWYTYAYSDRSNAESVAQQTLICGHMFEPMCRFSEPQILRA